MNTRFSQYLHVKGLSQAKLSDLSSVSTATISRFLNGGNMSSNKLQRILQVCDDLSLEWLFFGSGEMLRQPRVTTINMGAFAGADVSTGESVMVKNSSGVKVLKGHNKDILFMLAEKDRIISAKDDVISQRDGTINRLLVMLENRNG